MATSPSHRLLAHNSSAFSNEDEWDKTRFEIKAMIKTNVLPCSSKDPFILPHTERYCVPNEQWLQNFALNLAFELQQKEDDSSGS